MAGKLRKCGTIAAAQILAVALAGAAVAMPTCEGTYSATSLRPLPEHIVVGLDIRDRSAVNMRLAERFLAGITKAGFDVGEEPNVLLHVGVSRSQRSLSESNSPYMRNSRELSGLQGGIRISPPAIPNTRIGTLRSPPSLPPLHLRVDATAKQSTRVAWTAVLQCQRIGNDDGALAEDLGRAIGNALGKRIDVSPL